MADTVIKAENLSKSYMISHQPNERYLALRDVMTNTARNILSLGKNKISDEKEEFWALKDLNFEIKQGERVGIIGRNGAGKSTLLKLLSRISEPTTGRIEITGRVASLLEVGTGFHPELTGRENIFLNGAILGMSRAEIRKKFDEIVAFAEVEKFLDTPVKRYSSGMYVRLAFAVAAHLDPEILIVDEVLAVGDAQFQKKCLGKMEEVGKKGRTVLFVSHNMGAILSLCERGFFLNQGYIDASGGIMSVVDKYQTDGAHKADAVNLGELKRIDPFTNKPAVYRGKATLIHAELVSKERKGPWQLPFGSQIVIGIKLRVKEYFPWLELSIAIKTMLSVEIASTLSTNHSPLVPLSSGEYEFRLSYQALMLTPGIYRFGLGLKSEFGLEDYLPDAFDLEIITSERAAEMNVQKISGILVPEVDIEILPIQ